MAHQNSEISSTKENNIYPQGSQAHLILIVCLFVSYKTYYKAHTYKKPWKALVENTDIRRVGFPQLYLIMSWTVSWTSAF